MIIGNCPVCGAEMRVGTDMTNADRIRAMTDEELAEWLAKITDCGECKVSTSRCMVSEKSCACAWLDWLKQEVSE